MPRIRIFKLVSIVVHAIVITIVSYASLVDPGLIPTPRSALAFESIPAVVKDIPLPPRPRPVAPTITAVSPGAAPIVAPDAITKETGLEDQTNDSSARGDVNGVPGGVGDVRDLGIGVIAGPPPPPVTPPPPPFVRPGGDIRPPTKIKHVDPVYPALALASRKEGVVILEAIIDTRGSVESVRVLRGVPLLDQAAIAAVQQWRFTPTLLNGEPTPVAMTVTVNFSLTK